MAAGRMKEMYLIMLLGADIDCDCAFGRFRIVFMPRFIADPLLLYCDRLGDPTSTLILSAVVIDAIILYQIVKSTNFLINSFEIDHVHSIKSEYASTNLYNSPKGVECPIVSSDGSGNGDDCQKVDAPSLPIGKCAQKYSV